ncbi:MAG: hypothetical protein IJB97_10930, partial [Clostridia bacterium]|nr:hypothetical protein [Clostridia bacterium]
MKKKILFTAFLLAALSISGGVVACGGGSSDNPYENVETKSFLEELPEAGTYEVFSEISYEVSAGLFNESVIVDPTVAIFFGEDKTPVALPSNKILTLDQIGKYTMEFHFELPNGDERDYTREFTVTDSTAPTIRNQFRKKYREGDTLDFSKAAYVIDKYDENATWTAALYKGDVSEENRLTVTENKYT